MDGGDCSTAPATPGLLNIDIFSLYCYVLPFQTVAVAHPAPHL